MRTTTIFCAALLAATACGSTTHVESPPPDASSGEDTFSSNTLKSYASYSDGGASWQVQNGLLTGTGPAIQSVLIRNGVAMQDGWVEAVSSRADDGGLVLRFQSANDYYLLAFRDDAAPTPRGDRNLALYHHVGNEYDEMWFKDVAWTRGTAHTIRFEAAGASLRVYFDGVLEIDLVPGPAVNDPAPFAGSGAVGVRSYGADATWSTSFDTFRWSATPASLPPETVSGEDLFSTSSLAAYAGFTDGGSSWQVAGGLLTGTGPAIQSVLIRNGVTVRDGWVEAVSSRADDGGLVLRFRGANDYYLVAFRDDAAPAPRGTLNLALYHHVGGEYDEMWNRDVAWTRGTSHTIRFEAAGSLLRAYFDGVLQVQLAPAPGINDPVPYFGAGAIGVRHYGADATWQTSFDTFRWRQVD